MTAAYRLKGVGWFGGGTAVVLGFYLVSLQVAAERKKLEHLDAQIAATQRDIRALETEFETRANLAQLERWNGDTLALSAPQAGQFVASAAQLASMSAARAPDQPGVRTAALVVPSLLPAAAATPSVQVAPAVVPARAATPQLASVAPGPAPARRPDAPAGGAPRVRVAFASAGGAAFHAEPSPAPLRVAAPFGGAGRPAIRPAVSFRPRQQVALLDRHLLSDTTLGDLASRARAEGRSR